MHDVELSTLTLLLRTDIYVDICLGHFINTDAYSRFPN